MHRTLSPEHIFSESFEETDFVLIVFEERRFVYPPDDDVMQCSGRVEACFAWHGDILIEGKALVKRIA